MIKPSPLTTNLQLLQSYYRFLSLGKYLEFLIQTKDFSQNIPDLAIVTGKNSRFWIKSSLLTTLLKQIHEHPDKENIFWYLIEISAFKWVFWTMRELLDTSLPFKSFVQKRLGVSYLPFEHIIRLTRNVLSHHSSPNLLLKADDFTKQRDFLAHDKISRIHFSFVYATSWKERKGSRDYGIDIAVDFAKLKEGMKFFSLISLHNLYLLSELCFNLSKIYLKTLPQTVKTK